MSAEPVDLADLRTALAETLAAESSHAERMAVASAILSTALQRHGMEATLVGGGAIEFHTPGLYRTDDIDFVVEGRDRDVLGKVFESLGLTRRGRHWVLQDLFVEVPGNRMQERADTVEVGAYDLRVVRKEYVLGERIVGFRYWKTWAYGQQAIAMITAFGDDLDEAALRAWLKREQAEDAYELLRDLAASGETLDTAALDRIWHSRYR